jgi:hypothetical protein
VRTKLQRVQNVFADFFFQNFDFLPLPSDVHRPQFPDDWPAILLPPETSLEVSNNCILIKCPVVQVSFTVIMREVRYDIIPRPGGTSLNVDVSTGKTTTSTIPPLSPGTPDWESGKAAVEISVKYSRFHSKDKNFEKYSEWIERLLRDAEDWF